MTIIRRIACYGHVRFGDTTLLVSEADERSGAMKSNIFAAAPRCVAANPDYRISRSRASSTARLRWRSEAESLHNAPALETPQLIRFVDIDPKDAPVKARAPVDMGAES